MSVTAKIINFYGGPCSGKSTWCAGTYFLLKRAGVRAEMAREVIKDFIYEGRQKAISSQIKIYGDQHFAMDRLKDEVDVIVTDCPVAIGAFYGMKYGRGASPHFYAGVLDQARGMGGLNIFLEPVGAYDPIGRLQTSEQAIEVGVEMKEFLDSANIHVRMFSADDDDGILDAISDYLGLDLVTLPNLILPPVSSSCAIAIGAMQ